MINIFKKKTINFDTYGLINLGNIGEAGEIALVQKAYELSVPVGLGMMHFVAGDLSENDARQCINGGNGWNHINMDYVHGRCCKFRAHKDVRNGDVYISEDWQDHTPEDVDALLVHISVYQ